MLNTKVFKESLLSAFIVSISMFCVFSIFFQHNIAENQPVAAIGFIGVFLTVAILNYLEDEILPKHKPTKLMLWLFIFFKYFCAFSCGLLIYQKEWSLYYTIVSISAIAMVAFCATVISILGDRITEKKIKQ